MLRLLLVLPLATLLASGRLDFVPSSLRSSGDSQGVETEFDYVIVGGGTVRFCSFPQVTLTTITC
jgi:hypothetical protein